MAEFMENKITDALIEELLNEEETSTLDFKGDQYPFIGVTDNQVKSELLKDILAFANAWGRSERYILLGIDKTQGSRGIVKGVSHHIDDAQLQQFVNNKTQRPLIFSYIAYPFEGKQIGIIRIPLQQRPFFIKKDFGKFKKDMVYVRRGSSTDIADPDEIARMGSNLSTSPIKDEPFLRVSFQRPDGNSAEHISVPSILVLNKEEVLKYIVKIKMSDDELHLIDKHKNYLDGIADNYPNSKIYYPYKVDQVYEFNNKINTALTLLNSDFEEFQRRFNLRKRSLEISKSPGPPRNERNYVLFKISNDGRQPAENVIIYIIPSKDVTFCTIDDLSELDLTISDQRPKYIADIVTLANKLNQNDFHTKESLNIRTRNAQLKGSYSPFYGRPFNSTLPQDSIVVKGNSLKINLIQSLMHNHHRAMGEVGLYLTPSLKKGEKAQLEYTCHANNMAEPSKGFLTLEGV